MHERRAAEGLEHLQAAAHELVAAARVFLDAVEELIDEPEWMTNSLAGVVGLVKDVTGARTQPWERHAWSADPASATDGFPDFPFEGDDVPAEAVSADPDDVVDLTVPVDAAEVSVKDPAPVAAARKPNARAAARRSSRSTGAVKRISVD